MLFEGQLEDPDAPGHRLYPTRFCRECGHEVHVVTKTESADGIRFLPRDIDDTPLDDEDGDTAGYLTPGGEGDSEYAFTGDVETYPEDWREDRNGVERLRANRKRRAPQMVTVSPSGIVKAAEAKPYMPMSFEADGVQAYVAVRAKSGPRLKITAGAVKIDHPDHALGQISLLKAIGSTDGDFLEGLVK